MGSDVSERCLAFRSSSTSRLKLTPSGSLGPNNATSKGVRRPDRTGCPAKFHSVTGQSAFHSPRPNCRENAIGSGFGLAHAAQRRSLVPLSALRSSFSSGIRSLASAAKGQSNGGTPAGVIRTWSSVAPARSRSQSPVQICSEQMSHRDNAPVCRNSSVALGAIFPGGCPEVGF
jgi:hypothetical protein